MRYYDEEFATVEYDGDIDTVIARLTEFETGEPFREYMNTIIEAMEDSGTDRVIADTSRMGALKEDDQVWSVQDWSPRAEERGLEHLAMVMPESVVAEMSVQSVMEMTDDSINRNLFDDMDEAQEWIARQ